MQQNQYDPLALSHQAVAVAATSLSSHMLLEHTHDASRNIFSMYRQKTSNPILSSFFKVKDAPS